MYVKGFMTEKIHRLLWLGLPALFWLNSYVAGHCLAVAPQSGAKQFFIVLFTI
jgi:hypothetical protein